MDVRLLLNPSTVHEDMDVSHLKPCLAHTVHCVEYDEAPTKKRYPPVQLPSIVSKRPRLEYTVTVTHQPHFNSALAMHDYSHTHGADEPPTYRIDRSHQVDNAHCRPYLNHVQPSHAKGLFENHADVRTAFLSVGFDANSIFNQICPLRKGRWRKEEEAYAIELVKMVHANRLPLKFRQSLRTFLAQKLHSDEMRVLKKVGNSDAFAFARQRRHVDDTAVTRTAYDNERSIEPLETLRRAFLRSVQIEVAVALREYDGQVLLDSFV